MFKTISSSPPSTPFASLTSTRTGTKITYDSNGKVVSSTYLRASDIPDISIDQVTNLQATLDSLAPVDELPVGIANDILYYNGTD